MKQGLFLDLDDALTNNLDFMYECYPLFVKAHARIGVSPARTCSRDHGTNCEAHGA